MATLVENSRKIFEDNFDEKAIRKEVVKKKSLFQSSIRIK